MNSNVNIDQSFQFNFQFLLPAPYLVVPCFSRIYLKLLVLSFMWVVCLLDSLIYIENLAACLVSLFPLMLDPL